MNVLISIPMLLTGGTEVQTLYLVKALRKLNYNVTIYCYFEYSEPVVERFKVTGANVELLNLPRSIAANKLVNLLRVKAKTAQFDIVHVQYVQPGFLPILAYRLAGLTNVLMTVHQPADDYGIKAKSLFKLSYCLSKACSSVSYYVQTSWLGLEKRKKSSVVYNCLSDEWLEASAKFSATAIRNKDENTKLNDAEQSEQKNFTIAVVGRLRVEKGQALVIEALSTLLNQDYRVRLKLVGDGPDKSAYISAVSRNKLEKLVDFTGRVNQEDIPSCLKEVDVVVVPSLFEGFGLVAIECMALGLPVIASKVGGLSEIISHNQTGLLFERGNVTDLVKQITTLFENPELKRSIAISGQRKAVSAFTFDKYVENIRSFYQGSQN